MKFEKEKVKHRVIEDYRPSVDVSKPIITHKPIPPSRSSILFGNNKEEKVIKPHSSEKHHK